ncbi:SCP2 sterol-binding domain-containing protein [Breoghania sp. L-A4]|uniref:ubiquinone anaerobic biosynthesis accessory factor UbiT n=1 Tax=Breoghania sp. L-A4 TaxID=2304600 RepID=UPI0013C2CA8A|nr:SCP2 sterol-binding domain-containing protein [Breoghania sp. L-A4]
MSERGELPRLVSLLARPLPRAPLALLLTRATRRLLHQRPDLTGRLGATARVTIGIIPTDLPFAFAVLLDGDRARVDVVDRHGLDEAAARISGPLLLLLGLLDGTYDGDALFFSRDLVIEGATEHVLALRNTLEEAALTPADFAGLTGQTAGLVNRGAVHAFAAARRVLRAPLPSA